ncbi:MAG TPA: hypothetical protein VJ499_08600 [Flavisolibacter sp.]|nr:hypothetical protein [Flavisolibacter sp.]
MKCFCLYIACFLFLSFSSAAQNKTTQPGANSQATSTQSKASSNNQPLSVKTDSLKMAMNDLKTSFHSIFGTKRDTVSIYISNIEYDDANLSVLKDDLKKLKGVKGVNMQYKQSNAMLDISYNGKSIDLWDKLPSEARSPFKLLEAGDYKIILQYKNAMASKQ